MTQHLLVRLLFLHLFLHLHSSQMLRPGALCTWQNPGYIVAGNRVYKLSKSCTKQVSPVWYAALEHGQDDHRHPKRDRRYESVDSADLPMTESLKQTIQRVLPYWQESILPAVKAGKHCIIVGHGNSIRVT